MLACDGLRYVRINLCSASRYPGLDPGLSVTAIYENNSELEVTVRNADLYAVSTLPEYAREKLLNKIIYFLHAETDKGFNDDVLNLQQELNDIIDRFIKTAEE